MFGFGGIKRPFWYDPVWYDPVCVPPTLALDASGTQNQAKEEEHAEYVFQMTNTYKNSKPNNTMNKHKTKEEGFVRRSASADDLR